MLKNPKFYPGRPEAFDEKASNFIPTCHEGSWCTFRGPVGRTVYGRSSSTVQETRRAGYGYGSVVLRCRLLPLTKTPFDIISAIHANSCSKIMLC